MARLGIPGASLLINFEEEEEEEEEEGEGRGFSFLLYSVQECNLGQITWTI